MSSGPTSAESKEIWTAITRGLPNIPTFIRVILKREKLSEEAESYRHRYELLLTQLEQQSGVTLRPASLICDDDSGYFSANRPKGVTPSGDVVSALPFVIHAGFLLRRDDKFRWHRSWCKVDLKDLKFYIFEDSNEEVLVRTFSLENTSSYFSSPQLQECDKENCFIIAGILTSGSTSTDAPPGARESVEGAGSVEEIWFAAYTDSEHQKWKEVLQLVATSRESGRLSFPYMDSSTSTSSSNFSSNRDSMISTASSMLYGFRNPSRAESPPRGKSLEREQHAAEDARALSLAKQQQPLPEPPAALDGEEDEGNASEGTIYESIENLVMQFDATMRDATQALGQFGQNMKGGGGGGKKRKKKSLVRQHSLFSIKGKKNKALSQKKAELERGEQYAGFMHKKSSNGSWKKKWCVLKGCIFSYSKSPEDSNSIGSWVVLNADVHVVKDSKRPFVFSLTCKGAHEMFLSVDSEEQYMEWLEKLQAASKEDRGAELEQDVWPPGQDESVIMYPPQLTEGIYNVPRSITANGGGYDIPRGYPVVPQAAHMTPEAAIDSGIYCVPRSLLAEEPVPHPVSDQGLPFQTGGHPLFDTYAVPRAVSMSPDEDEEGIYDYPLDALEDLEIYDYPPDASELGLFLSGYSGTDWSASNRHSMISMSSEFAPSFVSDRASSSFSDDSWKTMSLPHPSSSRPSMVLSTASSDEYFQQSSRNSVASMEGLYDYPRSTAAFAADSFPSRAVESPRNGTPEVDSPDAALEYGQYTMRGVLLKREKMSKWTRTFCSIRNNFLECHKLHGSANSVPPGAIPNLKLFLPRSEVTKEPTAKKPWAFQLKHPRREGVMQFAAANEEEFRRWLRAFRSATSIEVQAVGSMEEIRITDLELQQKWKDLSVPAQQNGGIRQSVESTSSEDVRSRKGSWGRRSTISSASKGDYESDTLKRKKKFSWFAKRKSEQRTSTVSASDLSRHRMSNMSFDIPESPVYNPLRRSVSLELLSPTGEEEKGDVHTSAAVSSQDVSQAHRSTTPEGLERFQGYLRVQRKGADSMWVRYWCIYEDLAISCFISQRDLTLTLSIHLKGSRICEALLECKREHTFKVWHVESSQCLFFAADSREEYQMWYKEITRGAEYIVSADNVAVPHPTPYYYHPKESNPTTPLEGLFALSHGSSRSSFASLEGDNTSETSGSTGRPATIIQHESLSHQGDLKKLSHGGKWKDRHCVIRDCTLGLYRASSDKSPLASVPLQACKIELLSLPPEEAQLLAFRIVPMVGKPLTFATPLEQERDAWLMVFRDCSRMKPPEDSQAGAASQRERRHSDASAGSGNHSPATSRRSSRSSSRRHSKSKARGAELVSYVPASKLTDSVCSGVLEVQVGPGPWNHLWCVVHSNCLYMYQSPEAESSTRTIVLPGYSVQKAGPEIKRPFAIQLSHPGVPVVFISVGKPADLEQWFQALEQGSKAEGDTQPAPEGEQTSASDSGKGATGAKSQSHVSKKGPMRGDHSLLKDASAMLPPSGKPKAAPSDHHSQRRAIIHRYEKKIKKTRRVATQTEQNLKHQQAAMTHMKQEISRHMTKLQALSAKGDQHAEKKLQELRVKLSQIDKIIPYLSKYIAVNRQADAQTEAVLRESCNMELQKLQSGTLTVPVEHVKKSSRSSRSSSRPTSTGASSIRSSTGPLGPTIVEETDMPEVTIPEQVEPPVVEEAEHQQQPTASEPKAENLERTTATESKNADSPVEPSVCVIKEEASSMAAEEENPYAALSEIKPHSNSETAAEGNSRGNYVELDFSRFSKPSQIRPPSVNYAEVTFDPDTGRPVLANSPKKPSEDDVVATGPPARPAMPRELTASSHSKEEGSPRTTAEMSGSNGFSGEQGVSTLSEFSAEESTLTPESVMGHDGRSIKTPPVSPIQAEGSGPCEPPQHSSDVPSPVHAMLKKFDSPQHQTRLKSPPPPVLKKPISRHSTPSHVRGSSTSPTHRVLSSTPLVPPKKFKSETPPPRSQNETSDSADSRVDAAAGDSEPMSPKIEALVLTDGTPSVLDRIRSLQQKSS